MAMTLWRFVWALCVALAGSAALVASIAWSASAQQWTEVREGNFKVEMPGRPEPATMLHARNARGTGCH